MFEGVAIAVRGAAHPQCGATACIDDGDDPETCVNHVENKGESNRHQHYSSPYCPLAVLVRDLESSEEAGLQVFDLESVGRGCALVDAGNFWEPHVHASFGLLRGHNHVDRRVHYIFTAGVDSAVLHHEVRNE